MLLEEKKTVEAVGMRSKTTVCPHREIVEVGIMGPPNDERP
jgi:hypothetical protein